MQYAFLTNIYKNLFSTIIAFVVIALIYFLVNILFIRKITGKHQKQKMRVRSFYVASVIFLFLMAHVWVDGFTHLLAILGLVSAGLVVTNKEIIMNFVGWLVITWRGLFSEDDLIQIQQYKGYVQRIGILYITLYEVSELSSNVTGRIIRVPNGLVSNNALINFSQTSHLLEQRFAITVSSENNFAELEKKFKTVVEMELSEYYRDKREFSESYLSKKQGRQLTSRIRLGAKITVRQKGDGLSMVTLTACYFCFSEDAEKIHERILLALLKLTAEEKLIKLA